MWLDTRICTSHEIPKEIERRRVERRRSRAQGIHLSREQVKTCIHGYTSTENVQILMWIYRDQLMQYRA